MSAVVPTPPALAASATWQRLLPALAAIVLVLLTLHETGSAMVSVWRRSETFAHAFLVPPISLWLAWRQRHRLTGLPLRPVPWLLAAVALVCAAWLVADVASVNAAAQFALVTLVILSVPAVAGWAIARQLAFPLLFLYFAVPMGEFLLLPMMTMTADFTIAALRLSGVPVYREGLQFMIPSGAWSVVEACSGVRYLIASSMVGTLFAYLNYRSNRRRLLFVLFALVVPIVANWVRAYGIVMLGHFSNNTLAVGADHLIYGWVFFGVVVAIMFTVGARWTEAPAAAGPAAGGAPPAAGSPPVLAWAVAGGIVLLALAAQLVQARLSVASDARGAVTLALPAALGPWQRQDAALTTWKPSYSNPSAAAAATYRADGQPERAVGLWIGYYRDQHGTRELVAAANKLVSDDSKDWTVVSRGATALPSESGGMAVQTATLRDTANPRAPASQRLRVWQWYWVDGEFVADPVRAKLRTAWQRLRGAGDDGASVAIYVPLAEGVDADALLASFAGSQRDAIAAALRAVRDAR